MSVQSVLKFFEENNLKDYVLYSEVTSDTVEHAASLLGCLPEEIAKTMSFLVNDEAIVIVSSGGSKIDNTKYKSFFSTKAKMIPFDEVEKYTGHLPGGVCPFALKDGVKVYLDESLKKYDIVYTGGGDEHHTVRVHVSELEELTKSLAWIDVCKERE